jgi:hypothetical protein
MCQSNFVGIHPFVSVVGLVFYREKIKYSYVSTRIFFHFLLPYMYKHITWRHTFVAGHVHKS